MYQFVKICVLPANERAYGSLLLTQYYAGGKIEKNEMGGAYGAYGGWERCAQDSSGKT